jgi:acylphosphatase
MKELHAIVHGRVQMVMYRDFCCRKARKLGLVGYVKNLPDGTVEVVAQGTQEKLEKFLEYLRKGSLLSHVEEVQPQVSEIPAGEKAYSNFSIIW